MNIMFTGDRALGPTFSLDRLGWLDFESKSEADIKQTGAVRYATEADAVMLAFAVGNEPTRVMAVKAFPEALRWADMPEAFRDHHARVVAGEAVWAAWNAGFDRAVWNYATVDFPKLEPRHIIDVMAQASAAGLPPDLFKASDKCGGTVKQKENGKRLLKLFCLPGATATPQSHPAEWQELLSYARDDIDAMRSVFMHTRQLALAEWREYWAMEAINERGVMVDVELAGVAAKLAAEDRRRANDELFRLTGGAVKTVDSVAAIVNWMLPLLSETGQTILTKRAEETDDDGEVTRPAKYQLTRRRVSLLLAMCAAEIEAGAPDHMGTVERVLQIRLYGGSKTPVKYSKMLSQQIDGVIYGQYVFNGAGQTGRASSRGVQIHNLARDFLPYEHDAIEALLR